MQFTNAIRRGARSLAAAAFGLFLTAQTHAATITDGTLQAWHESVQQSRVQLLKEAEAPDRFLWVERRPDHLEPVQFRDGLAIYSPHGGGVQVPSGLIHHWIGTVFIPNANMTELVSVLEDYDSYSAIYRPGVVESKLLSRDHDEFTYHLKFVQKGFGVKAGLLADFKSSYHRLAPDAGYAITEATSLTELTDPGTPEEHPLTQKASHGYVEKVFTIVRYRQANGGVYLQVESLTLSREIPVAIRWIATPLVLRFSRQTMADTLEHLRDRVLNTAPLEAVARNGMAGGAVPAQ